MESILSEILLEVSKSILERVKKGKKLSVEEVMLLYLDLMYREVKDFRREVYELLGKLEKRIEESNKGLSARIDETNKRITDLDKRLSARIDETNARITELDKRLTARIDETNKRIDLIYQYLIKK